MGERLYGPMRRTTDLSPPHSTEAFRELGNGLRNRKRIVRLTDEEHQTREALLSKPPGSRQRACRPRIPRQVDADGPKRTDRQAAAAFRRHARTIGIGRRPTRSRGALGRRLRTDPVGLERCSTQTKRAFHTTLKPARAHGPLRGSQFCRRLKSVCPLFKL